MKQRMFIAIAITLSITTSLSADLIENFESSTESSDTTASVVSVTSSSVTTASLTSDNELIMIGELAANQPGAYSSTNYVRVAKNEQFNDYVASIFTNPTKMAGVFDVRPQHVDANDLLAGQSMTPAMIPSPNFASDSTSEGSSDSDSANAEPRDLKNLLTGAISSIPETGSLAVLGVISMGLMLRRQRR